MEIYILILAEVLFLAGTAVCFFSKEECKKLLSRVEVPSLLENEKALYKQQKMEGELAEALAYVRNMVILGRGRKMSGELLMEELADLTKLLRPAFLSMARSLHVNDVEGAASVLGEWMQMPSAGEIGGFLARWEQIDAAELKSSVDAFCSALRESRETRLRKRDELVSDLVYFPVVANCMVVLLNFIYVAYFIEQRQAMEALFF